MRPNNRHVLWIGQHFPSFYSTSVRRYLDIIMRDRISLRCPFALLLLFGINSIYTHFALARAFPFQPFQRDLSAALRLLIAFLFSTRFFFLLCESNSLVAHGAIRSFNYRQMNEIRFVIYLLCGKRCFGQHLHLCIVSRCYHLLPWNWNIPSPEIAVKIWNAIGLRVHVGNGLVSRFCLSAPLRRFIRIVGSTAENCKTFGI